MDEPTSITIQQEHELLMLFLKKLPERGAVEARVDELTVPVIVWRKVARQAARRLGRPIQTLSTGGVVFAVLRDWPASLAEQRRRDRRMHAMVDAIEVSWTTSGHPDRTPPADREYGVVISLHSESSGDDYAAPFEGTEEWLDSDEAERSDDAARRESEPITSQIAQSLEEHLRE